MKSSAIQNSSKDTTKETIQMITNSKGNILSNKAETPLVETRLEVIAKAANNSISNLGEGKEAFHSVEIYHMDYF
jgi:hypothetical protein